MQLSKPRGDTNQLLIWVVQWLDLFIWSDKPHNEVWNCVDRILPKWIVQFKCQWTRENYEVNARFKILDEFLLVFPIYNEEFHIQ